MQLNLCCIVGYKKYFITMIQFAFSYDKRKTLQGLRYHFISRNEVRILVILINVFAVVSAILFYTKKIRPEYFLLGSFMWIVIMLSVWFFMPYAVYKKTELFKHEFIAILDKDKLIFEAEQGSAVWQWKQFEKYFESPNFFHLYLNGKSFILLPKDVIGEEMKHDIRGILKEQIKQ